MNDSTQTNQKPPFRIGCSRKKGVDHRGKEILGYPVFIGSAWARRDEDKGYRLDIDITPAELLTGEAVLFLYPNDDDKQSSINTSQSGSFG